MMMMMAHMIIEDDTVSASASAAVVSSAVHFSISLSWHQPPSQTQIFASLLFAVFSFTLVCAFRLSLFLFLSVN